MLAELRVRNLLLIESAELALGPGLNVITGETGAGKTMVAHALDLLLGGKPRRGIVRPGAEEAYVEGVFEPPAGFAADPDLADLAERVPLDEGELVLARRVVPEGPTRSYMQGRSVSAGELRLVGSRLLAFFGQHEHRKLMLTSAQLEILDAFCGPEHLAARARFARIRSRRRGRSSASWRTCTGASGRGSGIWTSSSSRSQRSTRSHRPSTKRTSSSASARGSARWSRCATPRRRAHEALDPQDGENGGALTRVAGAGADLERAAGADEALDALATRFGSLAFELQDIAGELRAYLDTLEADPERLAAIEERLDQLGRLKRKHGGTIAAVLEHADRCRTERDRLAGAEQATGRLEQQLAAARDELHAAAAKLHAARAKAGGELAKRVVSELAELALADATFEVVIAERQMTPAGCDSVEFVIGPNPGVPAGPLRETASGGELSRVMLALMSVATGDGSATVVFDEVDAGVGGATARAVGERLRTLSGERQVVCITHLPQVASQAERHFRVVKRGRLRDANEPDIARTEVERLGRAELVEELCRMLGSDAGDEAARRHAENLLQAA